MRLVPETSALSPELRGQSIQMVAGIRLLFKAACILALAGCQALAGGDALATVQVNLTAAATESAGIRRAAAADRDMVLSTVVAAGTRVAQLSAVNAALGATLRASYTATPALRAVVVSAEDMGSSLDDNMSDLSTVGEEGSTPMTVSRLEMAASVNSASGCSSGAVQSFRPAQARIYLTAQVANLRAGARFTAQWQYQGRDVYSWSFVAERSRDFECIWFYATPDDFDFAPGSYAVALYADGVLMGSAAFTIAAR